MIQQKEGAIINISSVSAFQPTLHRAVYGAVKAFVQIFYSFARLLRKILIYMST